MVDIAVCLVFCIIAFIVGGLVAFCILCCLVMAGKESEPPIKQVGIDETFYVCPFCMNEVKSSEKYCTECGQKIDWSDYK